MKRRSFELARVRVIAIAGALLVPATIPAGGSAQTALNLDAIRGLVPFSTLLTTNTGRDALAANFAVTKAIHNGTSRQPGLAPFDEQQRRALDDAYITSANAVQLSDGLGTSLEAAYRARASVTSSDDGKTTVVTQASPIFANLLAYTAALTGADSTSGKFYFANETVSTKAGPMPISSGAAAVMTAVHGEPDVYGKAYGKPAGSAGADPFGDSRPYQTETGYTSFSGPDYFGVAANDTDYLNGPAQALGSSPSFPSGHTTYGYTESLLLATLVPERYPQMVVRAAEYGNNRIVIGAHYAMDVIAGRTLAEYDVAHLLAEDPAYVGQTLGGTTIVKYSDVLGAASADVRAALGAGCRKPVGVCAGDDTSRFSDAQRDEAFYESTQTYALPIVYPATASNTEDVGTIAPEAGSLLTAAFPTLTRDAADRILTATEGPGGGFLDDGSAFGVYSRLDLYKASKMAMLAR